MTFKKLEAREYTYDEIMRWEDPEWLVEGFVERASCIFISAQPKVGKSFFALRLGAAVSAGAELFGSPTQQGNVTYLAAERATLMKRRLQALVRRELPFDPSRFRMWPDPVMFANHNEVDNFAKSLKTIPDLLIVDTLRRCNDGDERDNGHMGQWTAGVERFRDLTGASVVVIHHDHKAQHTVHGRELESTFSGAGAILGNLDGYFSVRPRSNGTIVISSEGSNELNEFHATTRIENIVLGMDPRGNEWGSGVMVEVDGDGVVEEKPDLWPLLKEVLHHHPDVSMTRWADRAKEHEVIRSWWPDLNKSTVSIAVKEHPDEVEITKVGTEKRCRLVERADVAA